MFMNALTESEYIQGVVINDDCLKQMQTMPGNCVDLTFCSPPYEDARTYGIDYKLKGDAWVDWCVERFVECVRITDGLVCWVVEGRTRNFRYSLTPMKLAVKLDAAGVHLRKPPIFNRHGIPGSSGPDYWRNDYEFIIVGSKGGKLKWSDNIANGHPCKYPSGGAFSNRTKNGDRANKKTGKKKKGNNGRPAITNAGNVIRCKVGKGHMGDDLAHENEAPFPESLVEHFVKCFCKPGGIVLDPFSGSGTTAAVAKKLGRRYVAMDIRRSQLKLTESRLRELSL